jgi:hypothetical protein
VQCFFTALLFRVVENRSPETLTVNQLSAGSAETASENGLKKRSLPRSVGALQGDAHITALSEVEIISIDTVSKANVNPRASATSFCEGISCHIRPAHMIRRMISSALEIMLAVAKSAISRLACKATNFDGP